MKTPCLSMIVIVLISIGMNSSALGQVLPVPVFDTAHFASDRGTYPIPYRLINATLVGTPLDLSAKALFFEITAGSDGQLTVELPRAIIDSKNGSQDKPYDVTTFNIRSLGGPMKVVPEELSEKDVRILQINFTQDTSEIGIFGTYFLENYSFIRQKSDSPLKQFRLGIAAQDVQCNTNFVLIIKSNDNSPRCVRPDTSHILIQRGWAKEFVQTKTESVEMTVIRITNNTGAMNINYTEFRTVNPETLAKYPLLQSALQGADKQLERYNKLVISACSNTLPCPITAAYSTKIPAAVAKALIDDPGLNFSVYRSASTGITMSYINIDGVKYIISLFSPQ